MKATSAVGGGKRDNFLLDHFVDRVVPAIEQEMRGVIRDLDPGPGELFGLLRYHLGWVDAAFRPSRSNSGKRLRPVLCLLACQGCGGQWEQALPAAAAVELLHNFTLIHDDIQDQDKTRRGRPTLWSIWGAAQGINAGDTLFSVSQLALLRLGERGIPLQVVVEAVRLLNHTCVDLTYGQYLDISYEDRYDISVDEYIVMIEGKTAALIACACELGACIARPPASRRGTLRAFGRHAGLAFQMQDDLLGIWGDSDETGKPVGADIVRRKKTLPVVHAIERSAELRSLLEEEPLSEADVKRATYLIEQAGSRGYAERLVQHHYEAALKALDQSDIEAETTQILHQLAERLLCRGR